MPRSLITGEKDQNMQDWTMKATATNFKLMAEHELELNSQEQNLCFR